MPHDSLAERVRARAGNPSYRLMAQTATSSRSVLNAAARGYYCPPWHVIQAYVMACDADPEVVRQLWERASQEQVRQRVHALRPRRVATVRRLPIRGAQVPGEGGSPKQAPVPDPWAARTTAEFVQQLRALRAWGGRPSRKAVVEAARVLRDEDWVPGWPSSSTFYDAFNPRRRSLPSLQLVRAIIAACGADVDEWTEAWRAVSVAEEVAQLGWPGFAPPAADGEPAAGGTVHPLERPAR